MPGPDNQPTLPATTWDAALYQNKHGFVFQYGQGVLDLLAAKPGERILDLGCGTGQLTARIAELGAEVVGIDLSPEMIRQARANFPALRFEIADATSFRSETPFDAIFSNAALHWMKPPESVAARMFAALKPGGRLVAEFGGKGNIAHVLAAAHAAAASLGIASHAMADVNYFPSIAEYASLLERQGFDVTFAHLFDRPTPLDGPTGLRTWLRMFRSAFLDALPPEKHEPFFQKTEQIAGQTLLKDGVWHADYRRLRMVGYRGGV